ncbi:malonic semialdehyde reductase [Microvirga lotononidis]|uniref:Putative NADH dehydrogenase/NAD(P)H nitroreductase MicloDRAFT_00017300 n=1 Tax=Microvirga lotononidis TaxID=864069 RepID=I4YZ66_9HYPH|nr:malonic semialdehyde reductase [Microvirga lotononidis]EIM29258.1 nitroreductase [Microvirga lotononidis]WQO29089.1 malonic semialdehyde reductase [Microvirga lotononidis]
MPVLSEIALDQLFRDARTHRWWQDRPIPEATLREVADLAKLGPTSTNSSPGRFVFVVSREAKEKLKPHLDEGNVRQTMSAPATVIVAYDTEFYEKLATLAPNSPDARSWFAGKPEAIERAGFQGSCLQGAYLMMAARALGLDCGPMGGFSHQGVDGAFFPDGRFRSNFLINLGYGLPEKLHPRQPRLAFEEFCSIA